MSARRHTKFDITGGLFNVGFSPTHTPRNMSRERSSRPHSREPELAVVREEFASELVDSFDGSLGKDISASELETMSFLPSQPPSQNESVASVPTGSGVTAELKLPPVFDERTVKKKSKAYAKIPQSPNRAPQIFTTGVLQRKVDQAGETKKKDVGYEIYGGSSSPPPMLDDSNLEGTAALRFVNSEHTARLNNCRARMDHIDKQVSRVLGIHKDSLPSKQFQNMRFVASRVHGLADEFSKLKSVRAKYYNRYDNYEKQTKAAKRHLEHQSESSSEEDEAAKRGEDDEVEDQVDIDWVHMTPVERKEMERKLRHSKRAKEFLSRMQRQTQEIETALEEEELSDPEDGTVITKPDLSKYPNFNEQQRQKELEEATLTVEAAMRLDAKHRLAAELHEELKEEFTDRLAYHQETVTNEYKSRLMTLQRDAEDKIRAEWAEKFGATVEDWVARITQKAEDEAAAKYKVDLEEAIATERRVQRAAMEADLQQRLTTESISLALMIEGEVRKEMERVVRAEFETKVNGEVEARLKAKKKKASSAGSWGFVKDMALARSETATPSGGATPDLQAPSPGGKLASLIRSNLTRKPSAMSSTPRPTPPTDPPEKTTASKSFSRRNLLLNAAAAAKANANEKNTQTDETIDIKSELAAVRKEVEMLKANHAAQIKEQAKIRKMALSRQYQQLTGAAARQGSDDDSHATPPAPTETEVRPRGTWPSGEEAEPTAETTTEGPQEDSVSESVLEDVPNKEQYEETDPIEAQVAMLRRLQEESSADTSIPERSSPPPSTSTATTAATTATTAATTATTTTTTRSRPGLNLASAVAAATATAAATTATATDAVAAGREAIEHSIGGDRPPSTTPTPAAGDSTAQHAATAAAATTATTTTPKPEAGDTAQPAAATTATTTTTPPPAQALPVAGDTAQPSATTGGAESSDKPDNDEWIPLDARNTETTQAAEEKKPRLALVIPPGGGEQEEAKTFEDLATAAAQNAVHIGQGKKNAADVSEAAKKAARLATKKLQSTVNRNARTPRRHTKRDSELSTPVLPSLQEETSPSTQSLPVPYLQRPVDGYLPRFWTLLSTVRTIGEIYVAKATADVLDLKEHQPLQPFPEFVRQYCLDRYGFGNLGRLMLADLVFNTQRLAPVSLRVLNFARLCGFEEPAFDAECCRKFIILSEHVRTRTKVGVSRDIDKNGVVWIGPELARNVVRVGLAGSNPDFVENVVLYVMSLEADRPNSLTIDLDMLFDLVLSMLVRHRDVVVQKMVEAFRGQSGSLETVSKPVFQKLLHSLVPRMTKRECVKLVNAASIESENISCAMFKDLLLSHKLYQRLDFSGYAEEEEGSRDMFVLKDLWEVQKPLVQRQLDMLANQCQTPISLITLQHINIKNFEESLSSTFKEAKDLFDIMHEGLQAVLKSQLPSRDKTLAVLNIQFSFRRYHQKCLAARSVDEAPPTPL